MINRLIIILNKAGVFSRWINLIGIGTLFLVIVLNFLDVILRYIFDMPIKGVLEITEVMLIVAVFLSIAYTYKEKAHVSIDLITSKLSPKNGALLELITTLLVLVMCVVVIWQLSVQTILFVDQNSMHSQYFSLPNAPFSSVSVIGFAVLGLLILRNLLAKFVELSQYGLRWHTWLSVGVVSTAIITLAILWMQPGLWSVSLSMVGLIAILFSLVLLMTGMPVAFSLIITSFVFVGHIRGTDVALTMLGTDVFRTVGSYSYAVIPFFILMGFFCLFSGFGRDLYIACNKWVGHLRGGLAVATIGSCTAFASIVGDGIAAVSTMGSVALPEMRKYGYGNSLIAGSITSGATLGPIIPPSVPFILYGLLTQTSIGKLFVSGIVPGIILALLFCITIFIWCRINPNISSSPPKATFKQQLASLKIAGPIFFLFLLVIGGIYTGVFTPNEGGAVGAVVVLIIALIMRRFSLKGFASSLLDAGKVVSMVFLILIGAILFTRLMAWCNVTSTAQELIASLSVSPTLIIAIILIILFLLGFVIDVLPLFLIVVPIVHPIAVNLGFDPLWLAVLITLVVCSGAITPPVGINLFVLKGLDKNMPMGVIYNGAIPFVVGYVALIIILFFLPSLITWLPSLLD